MCLPTFTFHATCSLQATSEMAGIAWLGDYVDIILMDLSKAYDCLSHDLLIAKLEAYGLDIESLNILLDYLVWERIELK